MLSKVKTVRKKLTWPFMGNIVYALSQWLIITIIARYGNATDLGIYNIGLAVTAPIVLFFNFQLRLILVTDAENKYTFSEYFSSRLIHILFAYIIIIPVALIYSSNTEVRIVIILIGLSKVFESLSDICLGYFQKVSKTEHIGKSQFLRGIYTVSIVGTTYLLSGSIILSVLLLVIVMLFRFIMYDFKKLKKIIDIQFVRNNIYIEMIKNSYPLGFTSLVVSLNANIPRYVLDKMMGIEEVGAFSVLYYILIAANMFIVPIMLLLAPKIANDYQKRNKSDFLKLNIKLSIGIGVFSLLLFTPIAIFSGEILSVLYGKEYAKYSIELIVLLISLFFGFLIELYNITLVTVRTLKLHFLINLLVTLVTMLSSFYLIKEYGVLGATYTILISRVLHFSLSFLLLYRVISKKNKK